jgi:hypothetical protein
LFIY